MDQTQFQDYDFLTLVHEIVMDYEGDAHQLEKLIGAMLLARVIVRMPVTTRRRLFSQMSDRQRALL